MGVYLWFLFGGPEASLFDGRIIQALAQKGIVYFMIVVISLEGVGCLIAIRRNSEE